MSSHRDDDHDHHHNAPDSGPTLRVKALETLLVEKGLVDPNALDALVDTYEHKVGPRNGARGRSCVDRSGVQGAPAAELRYMVLPMRPVGTEHLGEDELAKLVTRDSMIGTTLVTYPSAESISTK